MLSAGIVGLPNVGKSTLFKAITNAQVLIENYPFATISPNVATCAVNDPRLAKIAEIFKPQHVIPTILKLHDIAGLVKGASQGQGLGNQFLANIREVDAICEVIRCFEDNSVLHHANQIDPVADFELIELELILADYEVAKKRWARISKKTKATQDKISILENTVLEKIIKVLEASQSLRDCQFSAEELEIIKPLNFLTLKPIILVANISEEDIGSQTNPYVEMLKKFALSKNLTVVVICAKAESEIAELSDSEKAEYLQLLNISVSGIDQIILSTYQLLNLGTFFTAGPKEVRAWTYLKGMYANECAGIIHTDFQRGFIRAQIYHFNDLLHYGDEKKVKESGKIRTEGKNYLMNDGDICHFMFNI